MRTDYCSMHLHIGRRILQNEEFHNLYAKEDEMGGVCSMRGRDEKCI